MKLKILIMVKIIRNTYFFSLSRFDLYFIFYIKKKLKSNKMIK